MQYIYFLTVDKCTKDAHPSKTQLLEVSSIIRNRLDMSTISPYPVQCFEYKYTKKYGKRLHLHQLLKSNRGYIPYKDSNVKGWSVKLEKLKTCMDVARTAGYIQKLKVDKCDIDEQPRLSPFKKDNKKNKESIKANPFSMYINIK